MTASTSVHALRAIGPCAFFVFQALATGQAPASAGLDAVRAMHWVRTLRAFACEYTLTRVAVGSPARLASEYGAVLSEYLGVFRCRLVMAEHRWHATVRREAADSAAVAGWYDGERYVSVQPGGLMVALYDNESILGPHGPKLLFVDEFLRAQDVDWSCAPATLGSSVHLGSSWESLDDVGDGAGALVLRSPSDEYVIAPGSGRPETWRHRGADGLAWETRYSNYRCVANTMVPMRIVTSLFVLRELATTRKPADVPLVEETIEVTSLEDSLPRGAMVPAWNDQVDVIDARTGASARDGEWYRVVPASASREHVEAAVVGRGSGGAYESRDMLVLVALALLGAGAGCLAARGR